MAATGSKIPLIIGIVACAAIAVTVTVILARPGGVTPDTNPAFFEELEAPGQEVDSALDDATSQEPDVAPRDSYDRYVQAMDAVLAGDSISFDVTSSAKFAEDGNTFEFTGDGYIKLVGMHSAQPQSDISYTMDAAGQPMIDMRYFDKDGYAYINVWGIKGKMVADEKPSVDSVMSQVGKDFQKFTADQVLDVSASKGAGVTTYTFSVNGGFADLLEEYMNETSGISDIDASDTDIGDVSVVVEIDDAGVLRSQTVHFDFFMNSDGKNISVDVTESYNNFKTEGVTISYPTNLNEYTEMTSDYSDLESLLGE
jgi:hypothetical protein